MNDFWRCEAITKEKLLSLQFEALGNLTFSPLQQKRKLQLRARV